MSKKKRIFNLLKPVQPPQTVWDKIYFWIVGKARLVIIFAELLIAIAFVSKVVVDTNAKNKTEVVQGLFTEANFYSREKESEYRKIIGKDENYQKIWSQSSSMTPIIDEILNYIPNPASEITINIEQDRVSILGKIDLQTLELIEQSIESSPTFETAFIDTLSIESQDANRGQGDYVLVAIIADDNKFRDSI